MVTTTQCMRRHGVVDFPDPTTSSTEWSSCSGHDRCAVAGVHAGGGRAQVPAAQPL